MAEASVHDSATLQRLINDRLVWLEKILALVEFVMKKGAAVRTKDEQYFDRNRQVDRIFNFCGFSFRIESNRKMASQHEIVVWFHPNLHAVYPEKLDSMTPVLEFNWQARPLAAETTEVTRHEQEPFEWEIPLMAMANKPEEALENYKIWLAKQEEEQTRKNQEETRARIEAQDRARLEMLAQKLKAI